MNVADADKVRQARAGDADAFAELIRHHERSMLALAFACTRCAATAADVVQEASWYCWRKLADLREDDRFAVWLASAVRSRAINAANTAKRQRMRLAADERAFDDVAATISGDPVVNLERAAVLRGAIEQLDETSAAVLMLRYYDDQSSKAIADLLDLTPAAVDQRLSRARQALRRALAGTALAAEHGGGG